jgi:prepilin-type N-terminal cleavage/methylation domain-containing protein
MMNNDSSRKRFRNSRAVRSAGFSLVEMLIASAVLLVVTAAVFEQLGNMERRANAEANKLDMSQQAREFADQMVRDLHAAGYPNASMYADQPDNTDPRVAAGLVSISPNQILLEGDVNGDGNVYSVTINYVPADAGDPYCPCIRRSMVAKIEGSPLAQNTSALYTETNQVIPPGSGPGESGQDLFTFYDQDGNQIDASMGLDISSAKGQATIPTVKTVKINLSLQGAATPGSRGIPGTSISVVARLNQ